MLQQHGVPFPKGMRVVPDLYFYRLLPEHLAPTYQTPVLPGPALELNGPAEYEQDLLRKRYGRALTQRALADFQLGNVTRARRLAVHVRQTCPACQLPPLLQELLR